MTNYIKNIMNKREPNAFQYCVIFRFGLLTILLFIYLAGVLILSAVTFHEPQGITGTKTVKKEQITRTKNYEYGVSALRLPLRRSKIQWCTQIKYVSPPRDIIALASFPGSGNTWLRYLLQQATGYLTGSIYKDYGLIKNGFPAENVMDGSVIVVKTHEWGMKAKRNFTKAILLVRAPGPAIQAEFNRQSGGHIGFASPQTYKRIKGKYWQQFVDDHIKAWKNTNLYWLYNFTGPTHIIFYEQLVNNVEHTLRTVIDFLEIPINEDLFRCAIERKEGIYRRKKRVLNFDPYTDAMKQKLAIMQQRVYEAIYNFASPAQKNDDNNDNNNVKGQ